jgi:drug/metabolite transporter (DMT)-like permease
MTLFLLIVSFLFSGVTGITNAALSKLGLSEYSTVFVLSYYATGLLIGAALVAVRRERGKPADALVGITMGVTNSIAMLAFLYVLRFWDGFFAFPIRSVSCLVLTSLVSMVIWRERLSRSQWVGAILAVVAILLLTA